QLTAPSNNIGCVSTFHGVDERAVDQSEFQVRSTVPHWERGSFYQVRESIQGALRLSQSMRELGSLAFRGAGIEQPQQDGPRGLRRRRWSTTHFQDPSRPSKPDLRLDCRARD